MNLNWIKNLLTLLFSTAIALVIIDISIYNIFPSWFPENEGNQYRFYEFDKYLGWTNLANSKGHYKRQEFEYDIFINSDGMRDEEFHIQAGKKNIAVLGDSFVWGIGVAYNERFTEVIEKINPYVNVLNFGVSGYGQLQEYIQLDRVLKHDVDGVILSICMANDILDNIHNERYGYQKPYAILSASKPGFSIEGYPLKNNKRFNKYLDGNYHVGTGIEMLISKALTSKVLPVIKENNSSLLTDIDLYSKKENLDNNKKKRLSDAYEITEKIILEIRNEIKIRKPNATFSVLLAPSKFETGLIKVEESKQLRDFFVDILERNNISFVDGTNIIESNDYWIYDGHWNQRGHNKIAKLINNNLI